ncbi:MAG: 1-acyl-sn-glycerol-3-phosphate acyltransferase [Candidatus Kapabacteria bacterium]|nr:1-acyl-sn-glycerol-3-phosphate acyltransferase [Candidatus Kapabacteria bacterium]
MVLITVYDSIIVLFNTFFNSKKYSFFEHSRKWSRRLLKFSGVKLNIIGLDNVNTNQTYIFISNHSSLFDIPVLFLSIPVNARIIYKKELEKIPVFGYMLKKSPLIPVQREDPRKAFESIQQSIDSIKEDVSVIIFPEGTRSRSGELGEFRRGAFNLATRSGKLIIPITIIGTNRIIPKGKLSISTGEVTVIFSPPIKPPQNPTAKEEKEMMKLTRNIIAMNLSSETSK